MTLLDKFHQKREEKKASFVKNAENQAISQKDIQLAITSWYDYQKTCQKTKTEYDPKKVSSDIAKKIYNLSIIVKSEKEHTKIPISRTQVEHIRLILNDVLTRQHIKGSLPYIERITPLGVSIDSVIDDFAGLKAHDIAKEVVDTHKEIAEQYSQGRIDLSPFIKFGQSYCETQKIKEEFQKRVNIPSEMYELVCEYGIDFVKNFINEKKDDPESFLTTQAIDTLEIIETTIKDYLPHIAEEKREKVLIALEHEKKEFDRYALMKKDKILKKEKEMFQKRVNNAQHEKKDEETYIANLQKYIMFCNTYSRTLGISSENIRSRFNLLRDVDSLHSDKKILAEKENDKNYKHSLKDIETVAQKIDSIMERAKEYSVQLNGLVSEVAYSASNLGLRFLEKLSKTDDETKKPELDGFTYKVKKLTESCLKYSKESAQKEEFARICNLYQN
jgi:hypothetical protein